MRKLLVNVAILLFVSQCVSASPESFGGIRLLEGYSVKRTSSVDAAAWTIEKKGGLTITFEAGANEGAWADPKERDKYSWYREQKVNGFNVRFALIKRELKTVWEPGDSRGLPLGNVLLVSFLLEGQESGHTANFSAKLANPQELGDALLMVLTFDPRKGTF
jgi:hypothetical protein